jgi:murein L,D-transpeptidase YcbB/YkuD
MKQAKPMWSDDKNVVAVRQKLKKRARAGLKKYGTTTMRQDLDELAWLRHLQEELMDACVYIEAFMRKRGAK